MLKQWCVKESVNASKVIQTHNIKWNVESFYQVTICRKKKTKKKHKVCLKRINRKNKFRKFRHKFSKNLSRKQFLLLSYPYPLAAALHSILHLQLERWRFNGKCDSIVKTEVNFIRRFTWLRFTYTIKSSKKVIVQKPRNLQYPHNICIFKFTQSRFHVNCLIWVSNIQLNTAPCTWLLYITYCNLYRSVGTKNFICLFN